MKKTFILFGIILLIASGKSMAQQEPMFTHYMFNTMAMNPAYAGTRNALSINGLSRYQWVGIEGAPRSHSLSLHTPISSKKIGIGFTVISDEIGPLRNTYFTFNYAYRLKLNEEWSLSLGLKAGLNNFYLGLSEIDINDMEDANFATDTRKLFSPNAGVGAYLYNSDFYFGFSAPKLIETTLESGSTEQSNLRRHYYILSGYVFDINSALKCKPSFSAKLVQGSPPSVDLTALFLYRERIWAGPNFRFGDAVGLIFDVLVTSQLTIGYSYDYSVNALSAYNKGSHEILISYDLDGFLNKKVKSPRYF